MKNILGLDLGIASIGWAYVHEAETKKETSEIIKLGVRVNPLTTDEQSNFEKGKPYSVTAQRTLARGARRNLQRYKDRRQKLIEILINKKIISKSDILTETGKNSTYETLRFRSKAAEGKIELDKFARVLLTINKKRGYKSNRKAKGDEEDGTLINGMSIAERMYSENLTAGQICFEIVKKGKLNFPDFYKSDLIDEFNKIWNKQQEYYPDILDSKLYESIKGQGKQSTSKIIYKLKNINTADNKGSKLEKIYKTYNWRVLILEKKLPIEEVAYVIVEINNQIHQSSGYLGAISDRSKLLVFNHQTIGQYLYHRICQSPHNSLKNQIFFRQDYLDEFNKVWEKQAEYYKILTPKLKGEIRNTIIFYQRPLKSQKGLISFCEFESKTQEIITNGKLKKKQIGLRVCPKSSPLFQHFKIWQNISNIKIISKEDDSIINLSLEEKKSLFEELNIKGTLKKKNILNFFHLNDRYYDLNFLEIQGNRTNSELYKCYNHIIEEEGYEPFLKKSGKEQYEQVKTIYKELGIHTEILDFNPELKGKDLEKQDSYKLWHLLYSYEGDKSVSGNDKLILMLKDKFGFTKDQSKHLIKIKLEDDYGNLSAKAIRKILPHLKEHTYSEACELAGYNHSHYLTKEENDKRELVKYLEPLEKNSLRSPVVEKILNQLINIVNAITDDPQMGKPDEIRIELARKLKKNADERARYSKSIYENTAKNEAVRESIRKEFGIKNPSRTDVIKYKLYDELKNNGYKTLYTNRYIDKSNLFSESIEIEHIIPKAQIFDDSFSNKTLEFHDVNQKKGDLTAYDFIKRDYNDLLEIYENRIKGYFNDGNITKNKYKNLLKTSDNIEVGFIERDLRESQYIAKKAKELLITSCRTVTSTSGTITGKLREDWGIMNIMKELNFDRYKQLGKIYYQERKDGQKIAMIKDWTKRDDNRHHAMDALTIAFTKPSLIQYLNNLNARKNENNKIHSNIIAIEKKELHRENHGKLLFNEPFPNFRAEAKKHIESILISHKAKNKVVTPNINKIKIKKGTYKQITSTPRGQLHKETIYGKSIKQEVKSIKISSKLTLDIINNIINPEYKKLILERFNKFSNDSIKAFAGKNSISKNPIVLSNEEKIPTIIEYLSKEPIYIIRKNITSDLKLDKIVDISIKKKLQERLKEYNEDSTKAFSNLDKNPIWQNREKGIAIKRVTITGVSNAIALHEKRDHFGNLLEDNKKNNIPNDYVNPGNNHHIAIYIDKEGTYHEDAVSFFDAVTRKNLDMPIIEKNPYPGWKLLFTMKRNEMFVIPTDNFHPDKNYLLNYNNYSEISKHLYRVQKVSSKYYVFRHHLETSVTRDIMNDTFIRIRKISGVAHFLKVRINNLGKIVQVGEY
ncbi:MAG: type II CRISPR RNA-guided endonuclease Cas9 [Bacteroidales bacterium]